MSILLRPFRFSIAATLFGFALAACSPQPSETSGADPALASAEDEAQSSELKRVLDRMLAPPEIHTEEGFTARLLIAPGKTKLYDPLFMHDHGDKVWINDDGGQEKDKGSQILAIDRQGAVTDVIELGRILPVIGFDIAPASFGSYGGQLFTVSQIEVGRAAMDKRHVVQRLEPSTQAVATVCDLPPAGGADGKGLPALGMEGRFGPEGSPFAGKFFAVTATNNTVYQVTPDGACKAFVSLDAKKWGEKSAFGLQFSPDGKHMLVSTLTGSAIARVRGDGTVESEPLVRFPEKVSLWGMAYAPAGFGDYEGELFVTVRDPLDRGQIVHQTQPVPALGRVFRITASGEPKLVASGFHFPVGVHFVGNRLWISDANGDFIGNIRELPDGFIVEISAGSN